MDTNQKLPLLQAYPLGTLEVEVDYNDGHKKETACLIGLAKGHPKVSMGISAHLLFADGMKRWVDIDALTPLLKPFAALTKQLPDGTIPAVEFAKLCLGEEIEFKKVDAHYEPGEKDEEFGDVEETVEVYGTDAFEKGKHISFTIYPDWTWYGHGENDNCAPAAAIDYLRRNHFALPLNGQPLVAGVDFIEKQD